MSTGPRTPRIAAALAVAVAVLSGACTRRLYEGPPLPASEVAVVHVGDTSVLNIDDRFGYAKPVGMSRFELAPGPHRIVLAFEKPATTLGVRDIPEQRGEGTCTIDFVAAAGKQYWLGSRPLGTDWTMQRWDGKWEGWIRDPSVTAADDVVARCTSRSADDEPVAPPAPVAAAPPAPVAAAPPAPVAAPPPAPAAAPPPVPAAVPPPAPAAVPPPAPVAAPPVAPAAAAAKAAGRGVERLRLGTWNLRRLGAGGERDYAAIAAVIDTNFDIVALTELAVVAGRRPGYDRLLGALGGEWAGMVAATGDAADGEHCAILYRTDALRPCPGWSALREVSVGSFRRPPVYGCFEVGPYAGAPTFDFVLAAYRAVADEDADVIAAEVRHLDAALAEMASARPGERDVIVAGQLHLEAEELALLTTATVQTRGAGAALNLLGEPAPGLRDHVLARDAQTAARMPEGGAIDVRAGSASPAAYRANVSNYLPVAVRLRVTGPDYD